MNPSELFPNFDGFRIREVRGLGYESGITRRDPSVVLEANGHYHVWYSKNFEGRHNAVSGFTASVFHAISDDGVAWREVGEALPRGEPGRFDTCGVFTPTVFAWENRFYMLYTAMPESFLVDPKNTCGAIGLAVAGQPQGPWHRLDEPVITCGDAPDLFDSLRVDDACVVLREGKVFLYYKGRAKDRPIGTTQMGLAIAEHPEGPYRKHADNPVLNSGHEVCVWPHGTGVACLVSDIGPQGNTLQYAGDGIHFERVLDTRPPKAPGPFRPDLGPGGGSADGEGITWGLAMTVEQDWPHLIRFDADLRNSPHGIDAT